MKLIELLIDAVKTASDNRRAVQHIKLSHGLGIKLYVDEAGANHLMLYRPAVFPSESEWAAVMRAWPQPLPGPTPPAPERKESARRKALVSRWEPPCQTTNLQNNF